MNLSERTLIGSANSVNRSISLGLEPVDQLVRERRDHALRPLLDVSGAERRLDDAPDPLLVRTLRAEHVHAHRAVQRRGVGRRP
jgi:hypothetical protein